jgi:prophage regulatory protein
MQEPRKPHERILRLAEVKARIGLGRSAIYSRIDEDPSFPRPVQLGTRKDGRAALIGFVESEIEAWIQRTIAKSRGEPRAS